MSDLTRKQKKEIAQIMYTRNHFTQKEVAARVGATEKTMSLWVRDGKWDTLKTSFTITREEQLMRLYNQIAEINSAIAGKEQGNRFADSRQADTINKLAAAIEKMERETGLADILEVSKRFLNWLRAFDTARAQELSALFDAFMKDNLK